MKQLQKINFGLGLQRQIEDQKDYKFEPKLGASLLPKVTYNRRFIGRIEQQYMTNSCTGHAISTAIEFLLKKAGKRFGEVSRLFSYYIGREIEGDTMFDNGAVIRNVLKAANKGGFCSEKTWSFDLSKVTTKPSDRAYWEASCNLLKSYEAVEPTTLAIRQALASGFVVVGGMAVYASMQSDKVSKTGIVPMPKPKEPLNGYHAIVICDYDDTRQYYLCVNSWGKEWGDKGFFWLPYKFKEIFDCWIPKIV